MENNKVMLEMREFAFNRRIPTFAVVNHEHSDIREFLGDAFNHFKENSSKKPDGEALQNNGELVEDIIRI